MAQEPGRQIGPYRIESVLGDGGMGRVFLAVEADPPRKVALKVLHTPYVQRGFRERFQREIETLAALEHPHIARLYAAGEFDGDDGPMPYMAMEYVAGTDIVTHADANTLDTAARLQLVATVARAVHHSHTRGIIHRDLKPSNILVDESGAPRVLDFGVAHVTTPDGNQLTATGELLGTVPYMAPEQLGASPDVLDPRCDVYALGVLAYRLVAGRLPHEGIEGMSIAGSIQAVSAGAVTPLGRVNPGARGDIETVVMKALATEPAARYASAAEFAADLERCVAHLPIEARRPTPWYTTRLFIRRHRLASAGIAVAVVALLAATVVSLRFAYSEQEARAAAEQRLAERDAVNEFLREMLVSADPEQARGREITVRQVVDVAHRNLLANTDMPASVADALKRTLGTVYLSLGEFDTAAALIDEARASAVLRGDQQLAADLLVTYATVLHEQGAYEDAEALLQPFIEQHRASGTVPARTLLLAEQKLAQVVALSGRGEEALQSLRELHERAIAAHGEDDLLTASIGNDLATVLRELGRHEEAAPLALQVWRTRNARLGADHPATVLSLNLHGAVLHAQGDNAGAREIIEEVVAARTRLYGPENIHTITAMQNLAAVLISLGEPDAALALLERAIAGTIAHFGAGHTRSLRIQNILAYALEDLGRLDEAEVIFRQVVADQEQAGNTRHPENLAHYNNLAMLLMKRGELDEAREIFESLLPITAEVTGEGHPYYLIFLSNYGECLTRVGNHHAAIEALQTAHQGLASLAGAAHPRTVSAAERLVAAYDAAGRGAEARALEATLETQ